jgi:hypothetical protein
MREIKFLQLHKISGDRRISAQNGQAEIHFKA